MPHPTYWPSALNLASCYSFGVSSFPNNPCPDRVPNLHEPAASKPQRNLSPHATSLKIQDHISKKMLKLQIFSDPGTLKEGMKKSIHAHIRICCTTLPCSPDDLDSLWIPILPILFMNSMNDGVGGSVSGSTSIVNFKNLGEMNESQNP
ncbi:hypothetical protein Fot_18044 [Forsythia ovata]|uniref:Uncharacterized protein n=1 Tax=Forsythia ovata TaxID=205694 RepID=A0ABD1VH58_9LAMI